MRKASIELPKEYGQISERELRLAGPPRIHDNTMRTTFKQCNRKFYWWKIRKVDYLVRPSYFSWGSAWHEIKGYWLMSDGIKAKPFSPEWKKDATIALAIGWNFWDNSGAMDNKLDTRANLERLWKKSLVQYPKEDYSIIKGGAEVGWLWPLPLRGGQSSWYFLGGSMDGVIYWEGFGHMPLEVKTTGMYLSDWWLMQWNLSSQITGYIWYVDKLLGTEQTYGAYLDMTTKQERLDKTPQFERTMQTRSEDQLLEFESDWRMDIDLLERAYDKWHFPKTTDTVNCVGGVGKAKCPYLALCLSGLKKGLTNPLAFPNLTYRTEEWRPWERSPAQRMRKQQTFFPTRLAGPSPNKTEINRALVDRLAWRNRAIFRGEVN